jgi:hypothetical protein
MIKLWVKTDRWTMGEVRALLSKVDPKPKALLYHQTRHFKVTWTQTPWDPFIEDPESSPVMTF